MATSLFQFEKNYKKKSTVGLNSSMVAGMIGSYHFGTVISGFNSEYSSFVNSLRSERNGVAERLANRLADNPSYIGMRSEGVDLAWKYEKADIQMGGKGSANWNESQRAEILETGRVRGSEGHHGKNVADHPQDQADPDNIRFYKSREEHLADGHKGDWQNSSDMPKQDKELMLRLTNTKRVVIKELTGIGITAGIAFGLGASIEVVSTLAREGISLSTVKLALKSGVKSGLKCAAFAVGTYVMSRVISFALEKVVGIGAAWANGIASPIVSAIFAGVEFIILQKSGYSTTAALKKSATHAAIRIAIWALGFIPYCGKILSFVATVIYTGYEVGSGIKEAKFIKELEIKTIEWAKPVYALNQG